LDLSQIKEQVKSAVDSQQYRLAEISARIHANPETAFQETKAAGWLTGYLEEHGFSVQRGICEMPTSFRASYGKGEPVIAFPAEYDALPDLVMPAATT